jgi:hypothetical protein
MSATPDTTPPERIHDLAHKLKRLADDPAAPPAEKEAARAKLTGLLAKHGMAMEDIFSDAIVSAVIPVIAKDRAYAVQVISMIMDIVRIQFSYTSRIIVVECTAAQRADILEAWAHYQPMIRAAKRRGAAERRRLRERIEALRYELREVDASIRDTFFRRYNIFPPNDTRPKRKLTADELARMGAAEIALNGLKGDAWQRKAGHIDEPGPIDRKHRLNG